MTTKRRIRCFLFDLGSTLWVRHEEGTRQAKERAYKRTGKMLHQARGGEAFSAYDAQALGRLVHKSLGQQLSAEKRLRPEYEPDFVEATLRTLQLLGLAHADRALSEAVFEALRVRIPASRVLFPDALHTLGALRQRGYMLGVVTNRDYGGKLFYEDLRTMGLLDYFEYQHMAISADLGIRKPHPDIFKYVLTRLSVSPEETAMVGDNLKADVGGAKGLNMLGIWKPKPEIDAQEQTIKQEKIVPDLTIEHLQDLLGVF
jgi:HAD superfamily hydrolase (TIGR01549 family)